MCQVDYDGPSFSTIRTVRARKEYKCFECGLPIVVGESHEYVSGKWDGYFDAFRTCSRCVAARRWLEVVCHGWLYGGVDVDIREHAEEMYGGWPLGIVANAMRNRWKRHDGRLFMVAEIRKLVNLSIKITKAEEKAVA